MKRILVFLVCFPLVSSITFGQEKQSDELLSNAIYQEEVKGNLEEAILIYKDIIKKYPEQRAITAEALFHLGLSNEKLGNKIAKEYYEQLVSNYGDQPEFVQIAKESLFRLSIAEKVPKTPLTPKFTKIKMPTNPGNGVLSPDGKRSAFIKGGDVWVIPVSGEVDTYIAGEPQKLTENIRAWDMSSSFTWSGDGKWIAFNAEVDMKSYSTSIYIVPSKGGIPQKVQVPEHRCGYPNEFRLSLSPDGKLLAYATGENSGDDESKLIRIYTIPVKGSTPKQLTGSLTQEPAFSPDGSKIAYVKNYQDNEGKGHSEVWVIPTEGGTPIQVSNLKSGQVSGPIWSSDGNMIAFHRRGVDGMAKEIWIIPVSKNGSPSGAPQKIELPLDALHAVAGWTPDNKIGLQLMNLPYETIYTVPSSGGIATQVTPKGWFSYPKWGPDGGEIFFRGDYGKLASVPTGGGKVDSIPIQSEFNIYSAVPGSGNDISSDGKTIVFSGVKNFYEDGKKKREVDIFTIPVEGGNPKQLTTSGDLQDRFPCWSPDGNSIAFIRPEVKDDKPVFHIYSISKEGENLKKITDESHKVSWAPIDWAPDGKSIAYFSDDKTIKSIPIAGGESLIITKINKVNSQYDLAWSPNGNKLAFTDKDKVWTIDKESGMLTEVKTAVDAHPTKLCWSPDGKKIAFTVYGGGDHELWLMEDFLPKEEPIRKQD